MSTTGERSPIRLAGMRPLASGTKRHIYQHPLHADRLIKVLRGDSPARRPGFVQRTPLLAALRRSHIRAATARELREYAAIKARHPHDIACLQKMYGFVDTDQGAGVTVEKLCDETGNLAPMLREFVPAHGLTDELRRDLEIFRAELIGLDIVAGDLNTRNIVYAAAAPGRRRLVLVDGLGDRTLIAVNRLNRTVNRWANQRRFVRLQERIDILVGMHARALNDARG